MISRNFVVLIISMAVILVLPACQNLRPSQHPLVRLDHVHHFGATRIAFAPSGKRLASGGFQGEIKIWTVPGGKLIKTLKRHTKPVRGIVWINSDTLVTASEDGRLLVWSVSGSQVLKHRKIAPVTSMTWSAKNGLVIAGDKKGRVNLFKASTLESVASYKLSSKVLSVAASSHGQFFAASASDKKVYLFNSSLKLVKRLNGHDRKILELRFSPDSKTLAGSSWFRIMQWNIQNGALKQTATEHLGAIISLDYHPDGKRIISLGRHTDANLRLTDKRNGKVIRRLAAHEYCGWNVRFSPNGKYIATSSEDESIRLYDLTVPYKPTWAPTRKNKQSRHRFITGAN